MQLKNGIIGGILLVWFSLLKLANGASAASKCVGNLDPKTDCKTCIGYWEDVESNCTKCSGHFDSKCEKCENFWMFPGKRCSDCALLHGNPACAGCKKNYDLTSYCTKCVSHFNVSTQCQECDKGWKVGNGSDLCNECVGHYDIEKQCLVCKSGWIDRNNNCTTPINSNTAEKDGSSSSGLMLIFLSILLLGMACAMCSNSLWMWVMIICINRLRRQVITLRIAALMREAHEDYGPISDGPRAMDEDYQTEEIQVGDEELANFLNCTICKSLYSDPVMLPGTGQVYCRKCIKKWFQSDRSERKRCPNTGKELRSQRVIQQHNMKGMVQFVRKKRKSKKKEKKKEKKEENESDD